MCLFGADFKHFVGAGAKHYRQSRKVSSIMSAKLSSIMRRGEVRLTSLFKPIRTPLWQALIHRPGT
jgi:hypothetical protein